MGCVKYLPVVNIGRTIKPPFRPDLANYAIGHIALLRLATRPK